MLKEKIEQDIKKALQEKDELRSLVLRGVKAAIHNKEIEKRTKLSKEQKDINELEKESKLNEEEIIEVFSSEAKKRKEAVEEFKKGERNEMAEKEENELKILKEYLPEQMSEENIKGEAQKAIEEAGATGPQDIGKVMSILMPKLKGKADGAVASKIVGEILKEQ